MERKAAKSMIREYALPPAMMSRGRSFRAWARTAS
jgi:hypothetical protein